MRSGVQRVRSRAAITLFVVLLAASACTDDAPSAGEDSNERLVGIYSATVTEIVSQSEVPRTDAEDDSSDDEDGDDADRDGGSGDGDKMLTVFLQAHEDNQIDAEVQVGVVNELDDWANVRFIDDLGEAVDEGADGGPVRDEGVLIGLGPVADGAVATSLVADLYISSTQTIVFEVDLRRRGGEWSVETPLEGVSVRNP